MGSRRIPGLSWSFFRELGGGLGRPQVLELEVGLQADPRVRRHHSPDGRAQDAARRLQPGLPRLDERQKKKAENSPIRSSEGAKKKVGTAKMVFPERINSTRL